jgi:hypothetical protein
MSFLGIRDLSIRRKTMENSEPTEAGSPGHRSMSGWLFLGGLVSTRAAFASQVGDDVKEEKSV